MERLHDGAKTFGLGVFGLNAFLGYKCWQYGPRYIFDSSLSFISRWYFVNDIKWSMCFGGVALVTALPFLLVGAALLIDRIRLFMKKREYFRELLPALGIVIGLFGIPYIGVSIGSSMLGYGVGAALSALTLLNK